ncbi:MAG: hypothetical protein IJD57_03640 [Candidatus Gastranaerophilales bacterium]|nr:hypothetical protein [Candidatus Gastranaerophilales bacterium]
MSFKNIDFSKINKIATIEIVVFILLFVGIGIYTSPYFLKDQKALKAAKVKADSSIFTAKVLEEFAQDKTQKASSVAQKICNELNFVMANPYDKKAPAFTYELNCKGCNSVEFDDKAQMVTITTYDKRGDMIARTVIKPPSFVKYEKED